MFAELMGFALLTASIGFWEDNSNGHRLNSPIVEMFSSPQTLKATVDNIVAEMEEVEKTVAEPGGIVHDLLHETSPDFTIHPFGSRVMGLGLRSSDFDVFVNVGNCYYQGGVAKPECMTQVERIAAMLGNHNRSFSELRYIVKPKVPILKAIHRRTGIHVDVSTRNGIAIENTQMIRAFTRDRRVRFVAAAVRAWARGQRLHKADAGHEGLSSYTLLWLVMFALMHDRPAAVLPVAMVKRQYTGPSLIIDGWEVGHCRSKIPKTKSSKTELELLQQFFVYYSKLSFRDVQENVICPYTGRLIPKAVFADVASLPSEFTNYKDQVRFNSFFNQMICNTTMCLQDPVEQSNNIAKFVSDSVVLKFLESCRLTAQLFASRLFVSEYPQASLK